MSQSSVPGVSYRHNKYRVVLGINGERVRFGSYYDKAKAEALAIAMRKKYPYVQRSAYKRKYRGELITYKRGYVPMIETDEDLIKYMRQAHIEDGAETVERRVDAWKYQAQRIRGEEERLKRRGINPKCCDTDRGKSVHELEELGLI